MPPDLNSLPPSPSPSLSPLSSRMSQTPSRTLSESPASSHTPPTSLAAAAALNAGMQNDLREESRRPASGSMRRDVDRARRRSSIRMNLNLNDPTVPAPGEMQMPSPSSRSRMPWPQSPHHERAPSLGELHQELEAEQEGQVNRLLNLIRQQQAQITALQTGTSQPPSGSAVDDSTPTSERSNSVSFPPYANQSGLTSQPSLSPVPPPPGAIPVPGTSPHRHPRNASPYATTSTTMSRQSSLADRSRASSRSRHGSPMLRPLESQDWLPAPARDESTFYQAETQTLTRENQMLKLRIRELERQLAELNPTLASSHSPMMPSALASTPSSAARPAAQALPDRTTQTSSTERSDTSSPAVV